MPPLSKTGPCPPRPKPQPAAQAARRCRAEPAPTPRCGSAGLRRARGRREPGGDCACGRGGHRHALSPFPDPRRPGRAGLSRRGGATGRGGTAAGHGAAAAGGTAPLAAAVRRLSRDQAEHGRAAERASRRARRPSTPPRPLWCGMRSTLWSTARWRAVPRQVAVEPLDLLRALAGVATVGAARSGPTMRGTWSTS